MPTSKQKGTSKWGKRGNQSLSIPLLDGSSLQEARREPAIYIMLTRSAEADYAELCSCSLYVLGFKEDASNGDNDIYQRFKDQLGWNEEGWYETNIMWKQFSPALPSNKTGSLEQLGSLLRKLRKDPKLLQQYDQIICDQLKDGIVERISDDKPLGKEFYLPHRPVIREAAESTKVRIVLMHRRKKTVNLLH